MHNKNKFTLLPNSQITLKYTIKAYNNTSGHNKYIVSFSGQDK